jgi:hypothetical protein
MIVVCEALIDVGIGNWWEDGRRCCRAQGAAHQYFGVLVPIEDEEEAVPAIQVGPVAAQPVAAQGVQIEASAADDGGELRRLRHRHEPWGFPVVGRMARGGDVEAEKAGRVEVTEAAEEGRRGDEAEPALTDEGSAHEAGGEGDRISPRRSSSSSTAEKTAAAAAGSLFPSISGLDVVWGSLENLREGLPRQTQTMRICGKKQEGLGFYVRLVRSGLAFVH